MFTRVVVIVVVGIVVVVTRILTRLGSGGGVCGSGRTFVVSFSLLSSCRYGRFFIGF